MCLSKRVHSKVTHVLEAGYLRAALPFHRQKFEPELAAPVDGRRPDDFLTANTEGARSKSVSSRSRGHAFLPRQAAAAFPSYLDTLLYK